MELPNQTPPKNDQDAFNRVWQWMTRPGAAKARRDPEAPGCMYRTPGGNACAVGCLLPDNLAKAADVTGGRSVGIRDIFHNRSLDGYVPVKLWLEHVDLYLLYRLQEIHDCHEPNEWPGELAATSLKHNLTVPA